MEIETTDSLVEQRLEGAQRNKGFSSENAMWWWCGRVAKQRRQAGNGRSATLRNFTMLWRSSDTPCGAHWHSLRIVTTKRQQC